VWVATPAHKVLPSSTLTEQREKKMVRYSLFVITVLFSAASAIAAINPTDRTTLQNPKNVTIVFKNDAFPVLGPIVLEPCAKEDCSDTPNG
jgi:hypothetical protein